MFLAWNYISKLSFSTFIGRNPGKAGCPSHKKIVLNYSRMILIEKNLITCPQLSYSR